MSSTQVFEWSGEREEEKTESGSHRLSKKYETLKNKDVSKAREWGVFFRIKDLLIFLRFINHLFVLFTPVIERGRMCFNNALDVCGLER